MMYPTVFIDYARTVNASGALWALPTPVFFGGMKPGEEIVVEIEAGKTLIIQLLAVGEPEADGM